MTTITDTTKAHSGHCRCGGVNFTAHGEPIQVSYCHCHDCRQASGAPVSVFVGFKDHQFELEGLCSSYVAGPVARRFCPNCGAPVSYVDDRLPGETWFMLGFMDRPSLYQPLLHSFFHRRMPWLNLSDDLPKKNGFSIQREVNG